MCCTAVQHVFIWLAEVPDGWRVLLGESIRGLHFIEWEIPLVTGLLNTPVREEKKNIGEQSMWRLFPMKCGFNTGQTLGLMQALFTTLGYVTTHEGWHSHMVKCALLGSRACSYICKGRAITSTMLILRLASSSCKALCCQTQIKGSDIGWGARCYGQHSLPQAPPTDSHLLSASTVLTHMNWIVRKNRTSCPQRESNLMSTHRHLEQNEADGKISLTAPPGGLSIWWWRWLFGAFSALCVFCFFFNNKLCSIMDKSVKR